jgi:hypothetical protein
MSLAWKGSALFPIERENIYACHGFLKGLSDFQRTLAMAKPGFTLKRLPLRVPPDTQPAEVTTAL